MITNETIADNSPIQSGIPRIQQIARAFIIPDTRILCLDQILEVVDDYILLDFTENAGMEFHPVKFLHATQQGYTISITMVDMESKELIKRRHRISNDICDWIIIEADFLFPNPHLKKCH